MNASITPPPFDAEKYWADKPKKTWVVVLEAGPRKKVVRQTMYCSAVARDGAIKTAAAFTFLKGRARLVSVRLATPIDLGCRYVPPRDCAPNT